MQIVFQPYPATIDQLKHWAEHDVAGLSNGECHKALWMLNQARREQPLIPR